MKLKHTLTILCAAAVAAATLTLCACAGSGSASITSWEVPAKYRAENTEEAGEVVELYYSAHDYALGTGNTEENTSTYIFRTGTTKGRITTFCTFCTVPTRSLWCIRTPGFILSE